MDSIKAYAEKIGALEMECAQMLDSIKTETRAFTEEEDVKFQSMCNEIESLKRTRDVLSSAEAKRTQSDEVRADETITQEETEMETRCSKDIVTDYVLGNEVRANEMTTTSTGRIIPLDYSSDIVKRITERSNVLGLVSKVNSKGDYKQIVAANSDGTVTKVSAGWTKEIGQITASEAKFTTITIGHHKLGSLVKLSLEALNQTAFDLENEVITQMVEAFADKAEAAILSGTGQSDPSAQSTDPDDMPYGLVTKGTAYTLSSAAITADDIVKAFHTLKAPYHTNAAWIMSNDTLCKVRLLKDSDGQYLFHQNELTSGYVGTILGKPVLVSEFMDDITTPESGATINPIYFGDFGAAYKANLNPEMSIQVLNEKYAEYGMRGVLGIFWMDGKPVNSEAYVKVTYTNS